MHNDGEWDLFGRNQVQMLVDNARSLVGRGVVEVQPDWSYVNYEILVNKAWGPRSCGTRVAIHTESFVFQIQSFLGN